MNIANKDRFRNSFSRRKYDSLQAFIADMVWPFRHRGRLRQAMRGGLVSPQFRERLMMVVTAVNHCRYCSFYHAKEGLRVGLDPEETRKLLAGDLAVAPTDELPALLFAQHYAETNGRPDPTNQRSLQTIYGAARAQAIETVLHMIRTGNLLGNSTDWLLYKVSNGRLGGESQY